MDFWLALGGFSLLQFGLGQLLQFENHFNHLVFYARSTAWPQYSVSACCHQRRLLRIHQAFLLEYGCSCAIYFIILSFGQALDQILQIFWQLDCLEQLCFTPIFRRRTLSLRVRYHCQAEVLPGWLACREIGQYLTDINVELADGLGDLPAL